MDIFDYLLIFGGCLGILIWVIYFLLPSKNKEKELASDASERSDDDPAKPKPTPAPVATSRSWSWVWWLVVIVVVALGWWGYKNVQQSTHVSAPPRVNAPGTEMRQKFFVSISPLSYNREKSSKGLRVENTGGYYTIVLSPGQKIVYDIEISAVNSTAPFLHLDFHQRFWGKGYLGYRINDVVHKNIFNADEGNGQVALIPQPQEFRTGKNELVIFSEKGQLHIDGNKGIVVYEK